MRPDAGPRMLYVDAALVPVWPCFVLVSLLVQAAVVAIFVRIGLLTTGLVLESAD